MFCPMVLLVIDFIFLFYIGNENFHIFLIFNLTRYFLFYLAYRFLYTILIMSMRLMKVQSDLIKALSTTFMRVNLHSVTIKNIQLTKDMKKAYVEIGAMTNSTLTDEELLKKIHSKVSLIKRELRQFIQLKYFPSLNFIIDSHKDRLNTIEEIFKQIATEKTNDEEESEISEIDSNNLDNLDSE